MKKLVCLLPLLAVLFLTSCATICGGKRYYAQVMIPHCPDAEVTYNGQYVGKSTTQFLVNRRDANKMTLSVSYPSYDTKVYEFNKRSFRGWAFVGTVLGWTGSTETGLILPWGVLVDGITGSWWKPSTREPGVTKTDNKHYVYTLDYGQDMRETLKQDNVTVNQTQDKNVAAKLKEIKELYESGLISEEEYQTTRRKILDSYSE